MRCNGRLDTGGTRKLRGVRKIHLNVVDVRSNRDGRSRLREGRSVGMICSMIRGGIVGHVNVRVADVHGIVVRRSW